MNVQIAHIYPLIIALLQRYDGYKKSSFNRYTLKFVKNIRDLILAIAYTSSVFRSDAILSH